MWHPFKNPKDRFKILQDMRITHLIPKKFENSHPRQAKIIKWLIQRDPELRPSSIQILSNDLLPQKIEDDYLKDAIKIISNPNTSFYKKMINAIFNNSNLLSPSTEKIICNCNDIKDTFMSLILQKISSLMKKYFILHLNSPLFINSSSVKYFDKFEFLLKNNESSTEIDEKVILLNKQGYFYIFYYYS